MVHAYICLVRVVVYVCTTHIRGTKVMGANERCASQQTNRRVSVYILTAASGGSVLQLCSKVLLKSSGSFCA